MASHILSVSELTRAVTDVLEAEFPFVWVRGQVTNLARPASGHIYFTLSDADAALSVVWFKGAQGRGGRTGVDPLTGEVVEPGRSPAKDISDGQEVLVAGRVSVYAPRGNYQLIAELVQPSGISDLALAFEALKRKLADAGLFEESRKRGLPRNPVRVAVVTSPRGAAVRDFLRLAELRGTGAEIRIHPVLVQGEGAPAQIAAALDEVGRQGWAQVVALIRGGGSLEDLWAFNTEPVAVAMARCPIPVVTGVGHEPDVSIADYVADRRFPTPSAVAVGLWPLRADLMQAVDGLEASLSRALSARLALAGSAVGELSRALSWLSPARRVERLAEGWREATRRLFEAGEALVDERRERLERLLRELTLSFGPQALAARSERLSGLRGRLALAFGPQAVAERAAELSGLRLRLDLAASSRVAAAGARAELLAARLAGLDPEAPLARGYSLVRVAGTGRILRSVADVAPGDGLNIRVADGEIPAVVGAVVSGVAAGKGEPTGGEGGA